MDKMASQDDWILLRYGESPIRTIDNWVKTSKKVKFDKFLIQIDNKIFYKCLEQSLFYAFISLPYTEALVEVGTDKTGLDLKKRYENIIKGRISENLILEYFSKDSPLVKKSFLAEHPVQTPYWKEDICDTVRCSKNTDKIISEVDVKGLNIKWNKNKNPSINNLNKTELIRTKRCPDPSIKVCRPLAMIFQKPWRHFEKLKYQFKNSYMKEKVEIPHENLLVLSPVIEIIDLKRNRELLKLLEEYYSYWDKSSDKREDFINIKNKIPEGLSKFTCNEAKAPESIKWLIINWKDIVNCIEPIIKELMSQFKGYWMWIFGFVNQKSADHFTEVYQNDYIDYANRKIWSSVRRSTYEKQWKKYKNGTRKSKPDVDEEHQFWNNNTIDVASEWVFSVKDYL